MFPAVSSGEAIWILDESSIVVEHDSPQQYHPTSHEYMYLFHQQQL